MLKKMTSVAVLAIFVILTACGLKGGAVNSINHEQNQVNVNIVNDNTVDSIAVQPTQIVRSTDEAETQRTPYIGGIENIPQNTETGNSVKAERTQLYIDAANCDVINEYPDINILDIYGERVLFTLQRRVPQESLYYKDNGFVDETGAILVYNLSGGEIVSVESVNGVYIPYGRLDGGGDYVYTAAEQKDVNMFCDGFIKRTGSSEWRIPLSDIYQDGDAIPMPVFMTDGYVVYLDGASSFYYEDKNDGTAPVMRLKHLEVIGVDENGENTVLYRPGTEKFFAQSWICPADGGCSFIIQNDGIWTLYKINNQRIITESPIIDCRAIYAWWADLGGASLFTIGFGDNVVGITSINNVIVSDAGEAVVLPEAFLRLKKGNDGKIAAIDMHWKPFLLTAENNTLNSAEIDLPNKPMEFFCDGNGKLYAHIVFSEDQDDMGLYLIEP